MKRSCHAPGFTLIELMAALAVVTIVFAILAALIGTTGTSINLSNRQVDTASQARIVFSRLEIDLTQMLRRSDVDITLRNPGVPAASSAGAISGLEIFKFLSGVDAPNGDRLLALVGYEVAETTDNSFYYCLQRAVRPVKWTDLGFMGLDANRVPASLSATGNTAGDLAASDYDMLAPGVVRMGLTVQRVDGTLTMVQGADGKFAATAPTRTINGSTYLDISQVASLVVTLVVADGKSLSLLGSTSARPSRMEAMAAEFPDALATDEANGVLPLNTWGKIADQVSNFPGVPLPVAQSLRVYQRTFPVGFLQAPQP